jgi:NAD(P)-dependent dehydrogenase (short-subunit alcohol dehydrogenase family)
VSEVVADDFAGLVAVVTGGASGIGAAAAELFRDRGAQVAVFDLSPDGAPDGTLAVRCDVTDSAQVCLGVEASSCAVDQSV